MVMKSCGPGHGASAGVGFGFEQVGVRNKSRARGPLVCESVGFEQSRQRALYSSALLMALFVGVGGAVGLEAGRPSCASRDAGPPDMTCARKQIK